MPDLIPAITISRLDKGARWSASCHGGKRVHLARTPETALKMALEEMEALDAQDKGNSDLDFCRA